MPGFPVLHHFLEFAQTHVCWVSDAIQPSHLLLPPLLLPSVFPSIRLFSNESALHIRWPNVLELQLQHQYFQWIFRVDFLLDWFDFLALQGILKSLSLAPQFESINSSVLSLLFGPTLTTVHDYWKNCRFEYMDLCWQSNVCFLICCLGLS